MELRRSGPQHQRPPLVLIVNDQEWSTRSLESILAPNGFAVLRAYTGSKGFERAVASRPDIIIIGSPLPDMHGVELCANLRNSQRISPGTPILVTTTGRPTRAERLDALRAGAWDYLGHPLDAEELLLRFDVFVRAKQDSDRAREEGLVDGLTGLYSLHGLSRRAREMAAQAYRQSSPLACVVFRADNPEHHGILESQVREFAERLRGAGRTSDAIGRIGEAEFAVFAPGADEAGAEAMVRRVLGEENGARVSVGLHAVDDYRAANLQPQDMLARASASLGKAPGVLN
jgi:PleD family two-component response regulator